MADKYSSGAQAETVKLVMRFFVFLIQAWFSQLCRRPSSRGDRLCDHVSKLLVSWAVLDLNASLLSA